MSTNTSPQSGQPKPDDNAAADLIRSKVAAAFAKEPSFKEELLEAEAVPARQRSVHQQFMHDLSKSGKSLADIQVAWHEYYANLSNNEKHQVWQEFYEQHESQSQYWKHINPSQPPHETSPKSDQKATEPERQSKARSKRRDPRSVSDVRSEVLRKVSANGNLTAKHHIQSLFFGMGIATLVVVLVLFSFFNERFVVPFINPSQTVASTPIISDPNNNAVGPDPVVVIPKINVEAPVVYDVVSTDEGEIQAGLERGVLHYGPTAMPGQQGNVVILGHSASNIFNRGKYKFAFILLKSLDMGDTFMLHKDGKRYVYKVYEKKIVSPNEVSVLGPAAKPSSATLITCDPPGMNTNRLVVIGEQISPDPSTNAAPPPVDSASIKTIPSNSPSLWSRLIDSIF